MNFDTDALEEIYSVSDLNNIVRDLLEENFASIWVEGEISNLVCPASGHLYFSLKDRDAQVRCAFFKGNHVRTKLQVENGMQVVVRARVSLYATRGDYQLIIDHLEKAGDGALQRAFEALKKKLMEEGLFEEKYKKQIPAFPKKIGVVTSPTGAAIRDILSVLKRRFPAIPIIIYPSQVQGDAAPAQLVQALNIANDRKECDVIILARGGGSLEDLAAFNDEKLARTIFASEIPIVTGVGHEIDFTIADFVADQRAPTPSAAAELVSPDQQDFYALLNRWMQQISLQIHYLLQSKKHLFLNIEKRLKHPGNQIQERKQQFDEFEIRLKHIFQNLIHHKKYSFEYVKQRLPLSMQRALNIQQQQFEKLTQLLNTISPLATLSRGYAIVQNQQEHIIRYASQVKKAELIQVRLEQGKLICSVEETE